MLTLTTNKKKILLSFLLFRYARYSSDAARRTATLRYATQIKHCISRKNVCVSNTLTRRDAFARVCYIHIHSYEKYSVWICVP